MNKAEYVCPKCKGTTFFISVIQDVEVKFKENGDHEVVELPEGDAAWDDDSEAQCAKCNYQGILRGMEA